MVKTWYSLTTTDIITNCKLDYNHDCDVGLSLTDLISDPRKGTRLFHALRSYLYM